MPIGNNPNAPLELDKVTIKPKALEKLLEIYLDLNLE